MKRFYERYWDHGEVLEDFGYKWPALKNSIPRKKNISILDFGCGKGKMLSEIIKVNPSAKFTGVDVSQTSLSYAKKKIKNATFRKIEDGKRLPFKSSTFDFVVASDVLEHVYDTQVAFSELARILKPNGQILISVPYNGIIKNMIITLFYFEFIFNPYGPHIRFFTKKSLARCLRDVKLTPLRFGYYGRFYPLSSGMYVLACK